MENFTKKFCFMISIHALREEGDESPILSACTPVYFYPRPPRGGRPVDPDRISLTEAFLSTPSARRATLCGPPAPSHSENFYPRPPRGGRHLTFDVTSFVV